jgi:hypothetical protein
MKLHAPRRIELRWWWEEMPSGKPIRLRDPHEARALVASLYAHAEHRGALGRFLHQGEPGLRSALDADELVGRLAAAIARGQVRIGQLPAERLPSWDGSHEEAAAPIPVATARAVPLPPAEEICWPCLRAAASARALREASADGAPFVAQD